MKTHLVDKIRSKSAIIGILGLGYVGLPLANRYSEVGYKVIGFDIDNEKVDALNKGESYIEHIPSKDIKHSIEKGFEATTDFSRSTEADVLIICVPTPLNKYREPDLSYIIKTLDSITPYLRKEQIISLESTTYPGTTEEEMLPRIEMTGLKVGSDIFLVYSPEREDPGNSNYITRTIPKVVGGHTSECLEVGLEVYRQAVDHLVPVSSTKAAEMTKLLENIYRAVNIGLVNEMKMIADCMDIDIYEVIRAAATKPFGFTAYYPGPGLGGHCIPIDPFYLTWKAREYNLHTRFIEIAGEINANMPNWVVSKVVDALNENMKSVYNSKILILGMAYKKDIDDMRESPSIALMNLLEKKGAIVHYSDPHIPNISNMRNIGIQMNSVDLTPENISKYDLLVLSTDHSAFDYNLIKNNAKKIVDTRGVYKESSKNIVKA
jgi:UDP-N-acetyl-D-glucosamine dehydrogenase